MPTLLIAVALLGFLAGTASAQQASGWSGNEMLPSCRSGVERLDSGQLPKAQQAFQEGACAGLFATFMIWGPLLEPRSRFCPPQGATGSQAALIVIRALTNQPEMLNQDLRRVVVEVLHRTWPCKG